MILWALQRYAKGERDCVHLHMKEVVSICHGFQCIRYSELQMQCSYTDKKWTLKVGGCSWWFSGYKIWRMGCQHKIWSFTDPIPLFQWDQYNLQDFDVLWKILFLSVQIKNLEQGERKNLPLKFTTCTTNWILACWHSNQPPTKHYKWNRPKLNAVLAICHLFYIFKAIMLDQRITHSIRSLTSVT